MDDLKTLLAAAVTSAALYYATVAHVGHALLHALGVQHGF
jgi:hypothetical protein